MLARTFKTANELGIPENEYNGLMLALPLLETDQIPHLTDALQSHSFDLESIQGVPDYFNMSYWSIRHECGTVGCIAGLAAAMVGQTRPFHATTKLDSLYLPHEISGWWRITPAMAGSVVRHYLETGIIDWSPVAEQLSQRKAV